MSAADPLPSLFGRFTAVLKDHEHLAVTLGRLRHMCAALEQQPHTLSPELSPSCPQHCRRERTPMENAPYSTAFRIASYVVLLLMAGAIVYSGAIAVTHWSGIGV